jgi:hypothetical protein
MNKMLRCSLPLRSKVSGISFLKPVLAFVIAITACAQVFAQKPVPQKPVMKRCGTMEALQAQMLTDPALRARVEQGEIDYQNSLRARANGTLNRPTSPTALPGPVDIPVVVHIVLPNPWIITDEAVDYFLARMTEDFAGINADSTNGVPFYPVRGHSLLRFVRAKRDINGNFTTGIIRKTGTTEIVGGNPQPIKNSNTATGGSTGWDVTRYYNLYVGDGGAAGLLGIAPNIGPGTAAGTTNADGVCVDYRCFANLCFSYPEYNLSRTSVHEVGHNFGLFHTFQDACTNGDFRQLTSAGCSLPGSLLAPSDDTPPQSNPTQGCPTGSIANGCAPPAARMYQSYMDYTDDACYSMFSKGEVARMEWVLENCRPGYLTTLGAQYPANMQALDAMVNSVVSPGGQEDSPECDPTGNGGITYPAQTCPGSFVPRLRITNAGTSVLTSITVTTTINGLNPQTQTFSVNIATGRSQVVTLNPQIAVSGPNALKFVLSAPNGGTDGNPTNDEFTLNFNVATALALPYVENFTPVAFPPNNGSAVINPDGGITWARTTLAGRPGSSMRINLYNYDDIGQRDIYRTPPVDLTNFDSLKINFYVAHQPYSDAATPPTNDSLRVVYSPDCGATWYPTSYAKGGAVLSTVPGTTTDDFVPTAAQWRKESLVLTNFCANGLKNIQIGFESYTDWGNNIYIDSIQITGVSSVATNAALVNISQPEYSLCAAGFTPEVTILNAGADTLKTLAIRYRIDNGPDVVTFNWTGSLAKCESTTITLAPANAGIGSHTIEVFTELPNGVADNAPENDRLTKSFAVFTTAATPIFEGFENNSFPSTNWGVQNVNGGTTWERSTSTARTGNGALLLNNPNTANGLDAVDYLISPIVVNSNAFDSVFVSFDWAYKPGVNYPGSTVFPLDTLEILATTDCGDSFISVWKKWGNELQTVNNPNNANDPAFTPVIAEEWKSAKVYLSPFTGSANFQLYFAMKGNKQNNLWIDNINITSQTLPQRLKDQGYLIYPNPFNSSFLIHHSAVEPPVDLQAVQVFNAAGQLVWSKDYNGNAARQITVDLKNTAKGMYVLKMIYSNKTVVEKLIRN